MIVDAHTHIFPPAVRTRRAELLGRDAAFAEMYADPRALMASPEELLAAMDEGDVDVAVVCGFAWRDPELCREHNDVVLDAARASGGRLLPFVAIPLHDRDEARREVDRCVALGARGLGELRPESHGLDLRDESDAAFLAGLAEALPLLIHTSEPVGHTYPGKGGQSIAGLYSFIAGYPDTTVIAAHMGGGLPLYAHMPEVRTALRNTYIDTAAWPLLYEPAIFRNVVDLIGVERILFATDFPLRRPIRERRLLDRARLTDQERRAIEGDNAARLFGLGVS